MISRRRENKKEVYFSFKSSNIHEKILVINELPRFNTLDGYIDFVLSRYDLIESLELPDEFKILFFKVYQFIVSLKKLKFETNDVSGAYNLKHYLESLNEVVDAMFLEDLNQVNRVGHILEICKIRELLDDYPEMASYVVEKDNDDFDFTLRLPKEDNDKWQSGFAFLNEKQSESYEMDLFKDWIVECSSKTKTEIDYCDNSKEFVRLGVHLEVRNAYEFAIQTLVCMVNSYSYANRQYCSFDKFEFDKRLEICYSFIHHLQRRISYLLSQKETM